METNSQTRQTKDYKRSAKANCRFGIDSTHYGSATFMANRPIYARELAPKQHIHLTLNTFVRTAQTLNPVFGHFDAHLSAFFVPYAMIWSRFNQFITQSLRDGALISSVPRVRQATIHKALLNLFGATFASGGANAASSTSCDIAFHDEASSTPQAPTYGVYNTIGLRNVMSTLAALGYQIDAYARYDHTDSTYGGTFGINSALPLLCWTKIWYDYFRIPDEDSFPFEPDKVTGDLTIAQVQAILNRMAYHAIGYPKTYFSNNETDDVGGHTNLNATYAAGRASGFTDLRTDHNDWDTHQIDTSSGVGTSQGYSDDETGFARIFSGGLGTRPYEGTAQPALTAYNGSGPANAIGVISDLALNQLSRMTDYVKRISIAGFSAVKRYLAEYGVICDEDYVLKTAEYIADFTFKLNTQEATCTGDTNLGAQLGASIKGGADNLVIDYTAKEFGHLIVYLNIRPKVEFVHGRPRWMQYHLKPMDFYHDDFDGFGYQGTASQELHVNQDPASGTNTWSNLNSTIGVLPVYAEYKAGFSCISGDFNRWTQRNTNRTFHLARELDNAATTAPDSFSLMRTNSSWSSPSEYERIFGNYNSDPFKFHFDFIGYIDAPMRPLFDLPGEWSSNSNASGKMNDMNIHM